MWLNIRRINYKKKHPAQEVQRPVNKRNKRVKVTSKRSSCQLHKILSLTSFPLIKMALNYLPEITLSKTCAKYLLARNAGEKALLQKKSFLLEKAKSKEERAFKREKELLLQRTKFTKQQTRSTWSAATRSNATTQTETEEKWEVSSDTALNELQRRTSGSLSRRKASLHSSHESVLPNWNRDTDSTKVKIVGSSTRGRSISCILPPITTLKDTRK